MEKYSNINTIKAAETTSDETYDLSGRRVSNPNKGLYIKEGKKVVIK